MNPTEKFALRCVASVLNAIYEAGSEEDILRDLRECGEDWSYFPYLYKRLQETSPKDA